MGRLEEQPLNGARIKPYVWWRFLDDIFMIWTGNTDEPKDFIDYLNNLHPTIKFTSDLSKTSVSFLDTTVSINNCKVSTDLYVKPTDTHQYLLSSSCHPYHTKRSIPYNLGLRLRRICSGDIQKTLWWTKRTVTNRNGATSNHRYDAKSPKHNLLHEIKPYNRAAHNKNVAFAFRLEWPTIPTSLLHNFEDHHETRAHTSIFKQMQRSLFWTSL